MKDSRGNTIKTRDIRLLYNACDVDVEALLLWAADTIPLLSVT
jgi:hypothetical protein